MIWFPAGEKHWHGASPTTALVHLAIQERLDGKAVEWLEKGDGGRVQRLEQNRRLLKSAFAAWQAFSLLPQC